jgi:phospholipid/cholesterol/gamma-HCH transport system permease protein
MPPPLSTAVRGAAGLSRRYTDSLAGRVLRFAAVLREMGSFTVITLGVTFTRFNSAKRVMRPLLFHAVWQSGVRLLPMTAFLGIALGLVVIGQTVALLSRVGAHQYIGLVMVTVVVRELGPLLTAILVLARSGTANAVELGTARALGEIEALESLGIDPIHYLVMPRVLALAVSVFALTAYLIVLALGSGYLFAFIQDVPLTAGAYFGQLAATLRWQDFALLLGKTTLFGAVIAVVSCCHGLARPLTIEQVPQVTTEAVVESVIGCLLVDAFFLLGYVFV